jgi:hypothetical protein
MTVSSFLPLHFVLRQVYAFGRAQKYIHTSLFVPLSMLSHNATA